MPQTFEIRREGMTVELLLHQAYGVAGRALVEETLDKNPGLSALGSHLPTLRTCGTAAWIPRTQDSSRRDAVRAQMRLAWRRRLQWRR